MKTKPVAVYKVGSDMPLFELPGIPSDASEDDRRGFRGTIPIDRKHFLIPDAWLVITVNKARNRLILHKIQLGQ